MNNLESVISMRETLGDMNNQLTPYSGKAEHQRYLDNLKHYKKILNTTLFRLISEIEVSIDKSNKILRAFDIQSENNNKKLVDGSK